MYPSAVTEYSIWSSISGSISSSARNSASVGSRPSSVRKASISPARAPTVRRRSWARISSGNSPAPLEEIRVYDQTTASAQAATAPLPYGASTLSPPTPSG